MATIRDLRIVFFGTPAFAVASLQALVAAGAPVVGVITAPDKPAGRGLQLSMTPVKEAALSLGIPVLQPPKLKDAEFLAALQALNADLHVVVAFRMLPEAVWAMPPLGTINVHASLLPQYRGAAPINWAIIRGETESGVTTFRLKHAIDTGNLLLQERVPIAPDDNAGSLHDKLMLAGAGLLVRTVKGLADGSIEAVPQPEAVELAHAPKIFRDDLQMNWSQGVAALHNFVRGLSPHPAAFTQLGGKVIKVLAARPEIAEHGLPAGTPDTDGRTYLRIAALDGWLYLLELQQEGKKRLAIGDFLRGFRLPG